MLASRVAGDAWVQRLCPRFVRQTRLTWLERCPLSRAHAQCISTDAPDGNSGPARHATGRVHNHTRSLETQLARAQNEPTDLIYTRLAKHAAWGHVKSVEQLVRLLVSERGALPNNRLYSALIAVNVNPEQGTMFRVKAILQELVDQGMTLDAGLCHDLLRVLSVHLDYLLRNDVLEYMRQRWFTLSPIGHHHVVAGLLREGQLDLARERLLQMRDEGIEIQGWLQEMSVYTMLDCGEIDEALAQVRSRMERGDCEISKSVWQHLLDVASAAYHHTATAFVWSRQVNLGYLNPSTGICLNALTTAAGAGDTELATDIFRLLGQRPTVFTAAHYELLLQTYLNSTAGPDLPAALRVLVLMASSEKQQPTATETRPLFEYFRDDMTSIPDALDVLRAIQQQGQTVPIALLNVVIESYAFHADFAQAFAVYKSLDTFRTKATIETFHHLLRAAERVQPVAIDEALYLASKASEQKLELDLLFYDRLVLICTAAHRLDEACHYCNEMVSRGWRPRTDSERALVQGLVAAGDTRCESLAESCESDELWHQLEGIVKEHAQKGRK